MTREGYRKHKLVIDWFYNQPKDATVLYKTKSDIYWVKTDNPKFFYENEYIINDEYVELRKVICEGKVIEVKNTVRNKWDTLADINPNESFYYPIGMYRIKKRSRVPCL